MVARLCECQANSLDNEQPNANIMNRSEVPRDARHEIDGCQFAPVLCRLDFRTGQHRNPLLICCVYRRRPWKGRQALYTPSKLPHSTGP